MSTTTIKPECTVDEARADLDATKEIYNQFGEVAGRLDYALARLHDRAVHKILGHKSWTAFIRKEFPAIDVNRSYQLIRHAKKVEFIEKETGQESGLNESQTRKLPASAVPDVAAKAAAMVKNGVEPKKAHAAAVDEVKKELLASKVEAPAAVEEHAPVVGIPTSTVSSDDATALQEASTDLEAEMVEGRPVAKVLRDPINVTDEKWINEAEAVLSSCPNLATLDAFRVDLPDILAAIAQDLGAPLGATAA